MRGRAEENFFGLGRGGAGANSLRQGRATVKLGAFSGQGGAVLKFTGLGQFGAAIFPGAGQGGACIPVFYHNPFIPS